MDEVVEDALKDLRVLFRQTLSGTSLIVNLNWPVSDKTIAEIGGRLLEDYILARVPPAVEIQKEKGKGNFFKCTIPQSQRAMEDIALYWGSVHRLDLALVLLVDVKGHNEKKTGSRPNLASIRKCIDLFNSESHKELVIFFCRYEPEVNHQNNLTEIRYKILDTSFGENGIFLVRYLSAKNLDPADIGSGGQILLARENNIEIVKRSRKEFVALLNSLVERIEKFRTNSKTGLGLA